MKRSTTILALFALMLLSGCKKDEKELVMCCGMVATTVEIRIFDQNGSDLMSPENINQVWPFKIVYPRTNSSGGFRVEKHPVEQYTYLNITMDAEFGVRKTTTLVYMGNNATADTLETQWQDNPSSLIPEKICYNGDVVWEGRGVTKFSITLQ